MRMTILIARKDAQPVLDALFGIDKRWTLSIEKTEGEVKCQKRERNG